MDQEIILLVGVFIAGALTGIIMMLIFNKLSTGSGTAGQVKREMEEYQGQVESHFEETSKKFKEMTDQYQDLYQHLSVGATTLCRPENIAPGLSDQSSPDAKALPKKSAESDVSKSNSSNSEAAKPKKEEKPVKEAAQATPKASPKVATSDPKKTGAEPKIAKTEAKAAGKTAKESGADTAKSKAGDNKSKNKA